MDIPAAGDELAENLDEEQKETIKQAHQMTYEEAAIMIQNMWRSLKSREFFGELVRQVWSQVCRLLPAMCFGALTLKEPLCIQQHFDQSYGMHYFVNNSTGESTWEAPYIVQVYLGTDEEADTSFGQYQSARLGNRHISPVEAAAMIQTAFRRYLAVLHVFKFAKKVRHVF